MHLILVKMSPWLTLKAIKIATTSDLYKIMRNTLKRASPAGVVVPI